MESEGGEKKEGSKIECIRCQTPDDILVVDSHETAEALSRTVKACHNHLIVVGKAEYDSRLQAQARAGEALYRAAKEVYEESCGYGCAHRVEEALAEFEKAKG